MDIELATSQRYKPIEQSDLHRLAQDPVLYERLQQAWALYPDHVVFLGPQAYCFSCIEELHDIFASDQDVMPSVVFIENLGVWACSDFSSTQLEQLRCYYEVLVRQPLDEQLCTLGPAQIHELIHWEAEHYRKKLKV
jgi:rhamnose utilization protein RhaD (predicted bifunctional aldolase and dehydrogenase)